MPNPFSSEPSMMDDPIETDEETFEDLVYRAATADVVGGEQGKDGEKPTDAEEFDVTGLSYWE